MRKTFRSVEILVCLVGCICGCSKDPVPREGWHDAPSADSQLTPAVEAPTDGAPQRKAVAKVLGKEIFEADLALRGADPQLNSATDADLRRLRYETLGSLIWQPLMEKYCHDRQLEPTQTEIEQCRHALSTAASASIRDDMLKALRASLESGEQEESACGETAELIKLLEANGTETVSERMARYYRSKIDAKNVGDEERQAYSDALKALEFAHPESRVKCWKFDRAVHAQFGGVVIFQQSNPCEPVGAYRKWLEIHERAGDFEIFDEQLRTAFWEYYKRDWESDEMWVVRDPDPLAQPWWLKKSPHDGE